MDQNNNQDYKQKLYNLILTADRASASDLLEQYAKEKGHDYVLKNILSPVLYQIGERWQKELSLAHGYLAGKITEDFLSKASQAIEFKEKQEKKGAVVIGNIEGDYHSLGRKMLGTFLKAAGWEVHDLGNDVLAADFVNKALETKAKIIGASAMMYSAALNVKSLREEIDKRNLKDKILLAVGGAIFNVRQEIVYELGGDMTAQNAIEADAIFVKKLKEKNL